MRIHLVQILEKPQNIHLVRIYSTSATYYHETHLVQNSHEVNKLALNEYSLSAKFT